MNEMEAWCLRLTGRGEGETQLRAEVENPTEVLPRKSVIPDNPRPTRDKTEPLSRRGREKSTTNLRAGW